MAEQYRIQMTRIKRDAYQYQGYISHSWLWYNMYKIEQAYSNTIKTKVWEEYVKKEIPPRAGKKMRELVEIG